MRAALHLHLRVEHTAEAQHFAVHGHALVGHGQGVALARILFDAGYRIEDIQHLGGDCSGHAGGTGCLEILAAQRHAGQFGTHFRRTGLGLVAEAVAFAGNGQLLVAARLAGFDPAHTQGLEALVGQHLGLHGALVLAQQFAAHRIGRAQIALGSSVAHADTGQQAGCSIVLAGVGIAVEHEFVGAQVGLLLAQGRGGLHHFQHLADDHVILLIGSDHGKGTTRTQQHHGSQGAEACARVAAHPGTRLARCSAQRPLDACLAALFHFACLFGFSHQFLTMETGRASITGHAPLRPGDSQSPYIKGRIRPRIEFSAHAASTIARKLHPRRGRPATHSVSIQGDHTSAAPLRRCWIK